MPFKTSFTNQGDIAVKCLARCDKAVEEIYSRLQVLSVIDESFMVAELIFLQCASGHDSLNLCQSPSVFYAKTCMQQCAFHVELSSLRKATLDSNISFAAIDHLGPLTLRQIACLDEFSNLCQSSALCFTKSWYYIKVLISSTSAFGAYSQ